MWSPWRRSGAVSLISHPPCARRPSNGPPLSVFVGVATPQAPELVPAQYLLSPRAAGPRTLIDILYDTAARHPESAAIDDGTVQLTYSELISDIEVSVAWLAARGIGRGDRSGIRMPSKVPCRLSRSAAPFGPTPRAPGSLSEGSPRRAMKSGTCSGSTPYRSRTSAGPIRAISPARTG